MKVLEGEASWRRNILSAYSTFLFEYSGKRREVKPFYNKQGRRGCLKHFVLKALFVLKNSKGCWDVKHLNDKNGREA